MNNGFSLESSTVDYSLWRDLKPGPHWNSFEQFRKFGSTALGDMPLHCVATLNCKNAAFKVLRDADFQRLYGLAREVSRLKQGITVIISAAKIVAKHPDDDESIHLLVNTALMLSQSNLLPERHGHAEFKITPEEREEFTGLLEDDVNASIIPRPAI